MKTFKSDLTMCSVVGDETYFYKPAYSSYYNPASYAEDYTSNYTPYNCDSSSSGYPSDYGN